MSYTTIYTLFNSQVTEIKDLRNGWGSAPFVWDYLEHKYLPPNRHSRMVTGDMAEIWALWHNKEIPNHTRFTLAATFDYSYCEIEKLEEGAKLIEAFCAEAESFATDRVNHWPAIATIFRESSAKHDYRAKGLCINCTSVSDIWEEANAERIKARAWGIFSEL